MSNRTKQLVKGKRAMELPLYKIWANMRQRCLNQTSKKYPRYGGRGITICPEWINSYLQFEADMLPTYQPGLTLDRKDNDGNYTPENCRWITLSEQQYNKRYPWMDENGKSDNVEERRTILIQRKKECKAAINGSIVNCPVCQQPVTKIKNRIFCSQKHLISFHSMIKYGITK